MSEPCMTWVVTRLARDTQIQATGMSNGPIRFMARETQSATGVVTAWPERPSPSRLLR